MTRSRTGGPRAGGESLDVGSGSSQLRSGRSGSLGDRFGSLWRLADEEGLAWLAAAVGAGALVTAAYLATHGHPAYEGGLYVEMAEAVLENGFVLPERIDGYTEGGIPFAYPPLTFYAIAYIVALTGVDPVSLELFLPGLVSIACLVPYFAVARRLLPTPRLAGLATVLYAVTPAVLQWHLSAGGLVRAPAMFLTLTGIYAGIRLFEDGGARWLVTSTALFSLVILTHPVYAAFFGLSYLVLFAGLDRSVRGLGAGIVVAVGGVLATAPWWLTVADAHGLDVFLGVNGTRTTVGGGGGRLVEQFGVPIGELDPITPFYVAAFAGGIYAATRRRYLLPAWMVLSSYGLGEDRFTFVAGSMLSAVLLVEVVLPRMEEAVVRDGVRRLATALALLLFVGGAIFVGAAYAGSGLHTVYEDSTTMPQTVQPGDLGAMEWARANTDPDADFVVVGDQAEWFPHYAERTILVTPWGTEWTSPARFSRHLSGYTNLSTCDSAACLEHELRTIRGDAEYVYVPTRNFTVRAREYPPPRDLLASLEGSDRYVRRYQNDAVVVFEVADRDTEAANGG